MRTWWSDGKIATRARGESVRMNASGSKIPGTVPRFAGWRRTCTPFQSRTCGYAAGLDRAGVRRSARVHEVARFVEKPSRRIAVTLARRGALWNSFVTVGSVEALWKLAAAHVPVHIEEFSRLDLQPTRLGELYGRLAHADFSRAVLERASGLGVVRIDGSGWADWGTPDRIVESIEHTPALESLLRRIVAAQRLQLQNAS